jgi:hypothetical protein
MRQKQEPQKPLKRWPANSTGGDEGADVGRHRADSLRRFPQFVFATIELFAPIAHFMPFPAGSRVRGLLDHFS